MKAPKGNDPTLEDPPMESLRPVHILKAFGYAIILVFCVWLVALLVLHFVFPRTDWALSALFATLIAMLMAARLLVEVSLLTLWHGVKKTVRLCYERITGARPRSRE